MRKFRVFKMVETGGVGPSIRFYLSRRGTDTWYKDLNELAAAIVQLREELPAVDYQIRNEPPCDAEWLSGTERARWYLKLSEEEMELLCLELYE